MLCALQRGMRVHGMARQLDGIPVGHGAPPKALRAPILLSGAAGTPGTAYSATLRGQSTVGLLPQGTHSCGVSAPDTANARMRDDMDEVLQTLMSP